MSFAFEMDVKDTFIFTDGTTVFTGPIETQIKFIGPCDCEVVQANEVRLSVRIDGEMVPSTPGGKPPYRAISTRQPIDLDTIGVGRTGFTIRSKV